MDLLEIGSADTAGVNPQQHFSRPDLRHWNGLHPHIVDATIDRCPHGGGNAPRLPDGQTFRYLFCHPGHCAASTPTSWLITTRSSLQRLRAARELTLPISQARLQKYGRSAR